MKKNTFTSHSQWQDKTKTSCIHQWSLVLHIKANYILLQAYTWKTFLLLSPRQPAGRPSWRRPTAAPSQQELPTALLPPTCGLRSPLEAARDGYPCDILPGKERQHVLFKRSGDMMPFRPVFPKTHNFGNTHTPSSGQACREQPLFADNRRADSCHHAGSCGHNSSLPSTATQSSDCYSAHFTGEEREAQKSSSLSKNTWGRDSGPATPPRHDPLKAHVPWCLPHPLPVLHFLSTLLKKSCFGLAQHVGSQFPDQVDQTCAPSSGSVES